jgi:hypothetical protein
MLEAEAITLSRAALTSRGIFHGAAISYCARHAMEWLMASVIDRAQTFDALIIPLVLPMVRGIVWRMPDTRARAFAFRDRS